MSDRRLFSIPGLVVIGCLISVAIWFSEYIVPKVSVHFGYVILWVLGVVTCYVAIRMEHREKQLKEMQRCYEGQQARLTKHIEQCATIAGALQRTLDKLLEAFPDAQLNKEG